MVRVITISIPFNHIIAGTFFLIMIASSMMVIFNLLQYKEDKLSTICLYITIILACDVALAVCSNMYMGGIEKYDRQVGWGVDNCIFSNSSNVDGWYTTDEVHLCHHLDISTNPFEQQPLHPLRWVYLGIVGTLDFITGNVQIINSD